MIYLNDIRTYDELACADKRYNDVVSFMEEVDTEVYLAESQGKSLRMFDMYTEEAQSRTGNAIINACRKIGEKIIEVVTSMVSFITDAVNKWKVKSWGGKSDQEKIRQLARKNPVAADQIKVAVSKGDLDFMSYSDFADFYKHVDEIIDGINKRNLDEKTLRGKWEKAKKKYLTGDNVKTIGAVVTIATGVTTTYVLWKRFKNEEEGWDLSKLKSKIDVMANCIKASLDKANKALTEQKIKSEKANAKLLKNKANRIGKSNANDDAAYAQQRYNTGTSRLNYSREKENAAMLNKARQIVDMKQAVEDYRLDNIDTATLNYHKLMLEILNTVSKVNTNQVVKMDRLSKKVHENVLHSLSALGSNSGSASSYDVLNAVANSTKHALNDEIAALRERNNPFGKKD